MTAELVKFMAITSCTPVGSDAPNHPGTATNGGDYDYILELSSNMEHPNAEIVTVFEVPENGTRGVAGRRIIEWAGRRWPTFEVHVKDVKHDEHYCRVRVEGARTVLRALELSSAQHSIAWFNIKYGDITE